MNIEHYRRRLLNLERHLSSRLTEDVDGSRADTTDPADAGDASEADELHDESLTFAEVSASVLEEIREALKRIEDGSFGRCLVDGQPIPERRLESVPWTPYCLKHQAEREARASRSATL